MDDDAGNMPGAGGRGERGFIGRNLPAALVAAASTAAIGVGVWFGCRSAMSPSASAVVVMLICLLWIILASPVFAAGSERVIDGLTRGLAVADGGAAVLIVLMVWGKGLSLPGAAAIYAVWLAVAGAASALVVLGRTAPGRRMLAAVAILLLLAICAGPFWTNAGLGALSEPWRGRATTAVVAANPVFATLACLDDSVGFVWNERPILYEYSVLGRDIPRGPGNWLAIVVIYGAVGAIGTAMALIPRRRRGTD